MKSGRRSFEEGKWRVEIGNWQESPISSHYGHMPNTIINPDSLAKPIGFSHAVRADGGATVYLAGQTAMDADGNMVGAGDMAAQFRQVLANLRVAVEAAGGALTDVVKLNIFVSDRDAYKRNTREIGAVYREYFGKHYPAMTLVEIKSLWDDAALIEIEGVAVLS